MADESKVLDTIYEAIDAVNEELPEEDQVAKDPGTVLVSKTGGGLDSLILINFVGEVEDLVEDNFDVSITLANEEAMAMEVSPFQTIETLVKYVCQLIEEEADAE